MSSHTKVEFEYSDTEMHESIAQRVADQVSATWRDELSSRIRAAITATIDAETRALIQAELRSAVADGWTETDSYGTPTGKTLSLRDRVSRALNNRDYSNPLNDKNISEMVKGALATALKDEIEAARVKFRAQIDDILRAKLADALRNALGLNF